MIKFLEHKIKDPNFIRLVKRIFRTPIQENGKIETLTGGAVQWDNFTSTIQYCYESSQFTALTSRIFTAEFLIKVRSVF